MKTNTIIRGFIILVLNIIIACNILPAEGVGTSAGLTLLEPISARAAAMAESGCSLSGEVYNFNYNPASLTAVERPEISVMYMRGLAEDNLASIAFGKDFSFAPLGMSLIYYDTGKIEMYDVGGTAISETGQRDIVFTVGSAKNIFGYDVGLNLKVISSEIFGETAIAYAADLGWQYKDIIENLDIGVAVRNLGTELTYIDEGDPLPTNICPGGSFTKSWETCSLLTSLDIPYYLNEEEVLALLGLECKYKEMFSIRAGYRTALTDTASKDRVISAGFGFNWNQYAFEYALGITRDVSNPHNISFKMQL
jgi:hypothetical protein